MSKSTPEIDATAAVGKSAVQRFVMLLWALPTWTLTNLLTPFLPKVHPWRRRRFSLTDWCAGRTELAKMFDSALWGQIVFLTIFIIAI